MSRQSTNSHMEKKMVLTSLLASELSSQTPQALESESTTRTRQRRRRKAKGDDEAKKRRLSDEQVQYLEMSFRDERKLESARKAHLAAEAGLEPKQVAVWFQNRRARHKSKQVEEAYGRLKAAHDAVVVEKCQLENQLMNMKEKLCEAEEEIRKLSLGMVNNGGHAERGGSPSSSFSTASGHQPFAAEFEVKGEDEFVCVQDYSLGNYYLMDQWANFYDL